MIASNLIYQAQENIIWHTADVDIEIYESMLEELDPENKQEVDDYIRYKTGLETAKLKKNYEKETPWKTQIIDQKISEFIEQMNYYQYKEKNKDEFEKAKKQYEDTIKKLNEEDWRYFVKKDLEQNREDLQKQEQLRTVEQNEQEKQIIEDQIYQLQLEGQILNWRLEKDIPYGYADYHNTCLVKYQNAKLQIRMYEKSNNQEDYSQKQEYYNNLEIAAITQHDIEHKTNSGNAGTAQGMLKDVYNSFEIFIIIIIVMIAGTMVSEEFSKGTIKLLLIKPYKRSTILAAKLISSFIILLLVIVLIIGMQFIVGGIIKGFDSFANPVMIYNHHTNELQEMGMIGYLGITLLGKLPIYISLMILAFAISTIFTNSALSIAITLLGYMGSSLVNTLGLALKLNWLKFFITPNWDLSQQFFGRLPDYEGLSIGFSVAIVVVYLLIMLVPTFIVFKKKNIKNI